MAHGNGKQSKGNPAALVAEPQSAITSRRASVSRRARAQRTATADDLIGERLWQQLTAPEANGQRQALFQKWSVSLAERSVPAPLSKLRRRKGSWPLLWGAPASSVHLFREYLGLRPDPAPRLGAQRPPGSAPNMDAVRRWLADEPSAAPSGRQGDEVTALTALHWAYEIRDLAGSLTAEEWIGLLRELMQLSRQAAVGGPLSSPWSAQMLTVELPLVLAAQLPELPPCKALAQPATERLDDSLVELTDGEGMLAAAHLNWVWPLLMCWTRCLTLARTHTASPVGKDARLQFEWLVRNALRICRPDGGLPLATAGDRPAIDQTLPGLQLALQISGDAQDRALARCVLEGKKVAEHRLPPDPGFHSEWAELAVLQCHWSPKQPRWTIDFSRPVVRGELLQRGRQLLAGDFATSVRRDGQLLDCSGEWDSVCWFSDDDVDFLELELALADDWVLQRQFLLARQDRFCFLADYVLGPGPAALEYQLELPMPEGIVVESGLETRELFLCDARRRLAAFLPLALPEWQDERSASCFSSSTGSSLRLRQTAQGRALAATLFIDLEPHRAKKPLTWRQLTVAENLQVVPRDVAVAYRVQVGAQQWLLYRSLTPIGNRTALGQNFSSEFMCGRIIARGEVEHLIEIESE